MLNVMTAPAVVQPMPAVQPVVQNQGESNNLSALVNRLAIERVELSQTRMHQVMSQVSDAHSKRQVAVDLLGQIQQHTDGAGKLDVAKLDRSVVQRAQEVFGQRIGSLSGKLDAAQTQALRNQVEALDRQYGNLEVTDQMKLQQLVQNLQREVQLFTNLMERLHRIAETALNGIGGR
jgi:hypothetical protein